MPRHGKTRALQSYQDKRAEETGCIIFTAFQEFPEERSSFSLRYCSITVSANKSAKTEENRTKWKKKQEIFRK
jgi:hypothetical protein